MRLRTKIRAASMLIAAATIVPLSTLPAQAATYRTVCNSGNSDGEIRAYNTHISPNYSNTLYPGECTTTARDDGGWLRVDVDPPGGWIDVDSWTKRHIGDPWDPNLCYEAENHASDPFSDSYGTSYWVFQYNGCTNA
jgi:hypothetical protein